MRPAALLALPLVATALLAGCARPAEPPVDVMTTFYPLQFLAQRIGGPNLTVGAIVKPGVEPHDYEPTPRDVRRIVDARVLIVLGAGFEGWLRTAQEQARETTLVVATEGLQLRENEDEEERQELPNDPHTWLSPVLMQDMARNVRDGLAEVWPERAEEMRANADALIADLEALHQEFEAGLRVCEVRIVISNHGAFHYMADEYRFRLIPITGLDPEREPDPATVRRVVDEARANDVRVIFFEELVSPAVAETIAREVGARTQVLSPVESLSEERAAKGDDYFTLMREDLAALRDGMRCAA